MRQARTFVALIAASALLAACGTNAADQVAPTQTPYPTQAVSVASSPEATPATAQQETNPQTTNFVVKPVPVADPSEFISSIAAQVDREVDELVLADTPWSKETFEIEGSVVEYDGETIIWFRLISRLNERRMDKEEGFQFWRAAERRIFEIIYENLSQIEFDKLYFSTALPTYGTTSADPAVPLGFSYLNRSMIEASQGKWSTEIRLEKIGSGGDGAPPFAAKAN